MRHRKNCRHLLIAIVFAGASLLSPSAILPAAAQTAPPPINTAATNTAATKQKSSSLPGGETFSTAAAAVAHCPGGIVVWTTFSKSKVFHLSTSKYYGKTKHGAYICEKDAVSEGYHASKR